MQRPRVSLVVVWLAAANLRMALFALQPVLPQIRHDLGLSFTLTGGLTSMALGVLGAASIPGVWVAWRLGARRTVAVMAVAVALASVARLLPPENVLIFAGTAVLAACVSFSQPAATVLVRRWFPDRIHRASAIYGNGILIGGTIGSTLTPLIAAYAGWRTSFWVWAAMSLATAGLWLWLSPRTDAPVPRLSLAETLRNVRAWQVTALFTFQNLAYFSASAWLPFLLAGSSPAYVSWVFTCLNLLPVLPLLVLPALRWTYSTSRVFYFGAGLIVVAGAGGLTLGLREQAWWLAFLIGLGCSGAFIGVMSLMPAVAESDSEAAAITAVVFAFGYLFAFFSPVLGGSLVDVTHAVTTAFWPSLVGGVMMVVLGLVIPRLVVPGATEAAA
ncbi:MAG TPA: MFS transporter [Candidatus Dormibacteraeota bacterium]|nr:MFS transporter [Candidatus Dormibacteraeota bacterium]